MTPEKHFGICLLDYQNNLYFHNGRFFSETPLENYNEIVDFAFGHSRDNDYILEENGNLYLSGHGGLLDTNIQKISFDDEWSYDSFLLDKKVKDISLNYYVDVFNNIYKYNEDGIYPIPKLGK